MKRKTKIKCIAVCMMLIFFSNMTVLAIGPSAVGTVGKFTESLSAKLAETPKDEKVSAYVFFEDDSDPVLSTMKADYAELFTTYAAAKGITVTAAEQKATAATAAQQTANIDGEKLQEAIEVKRQLYRNYYSAKNAAVLEDYCADEDVLFVSSYAPMAIVSGTARELKALALDASVTQMELFENAQVVAPVEVEDSAQTRDEIDEAQHWNYNSRANYVRDTLGLTGAGVKIGQVECGLPYLDDSCLTDATIITNSEFGGTGWGSEEYETHATIVARVMVGDFGIAPSATLYSACAENSAQMYNAIDWLVSQGVNAINMSAGIGSTDIYNNHYDAFCEYIDNLSLLYDVHFVVAAGNFDADSPDYELERPTLAYNAIVVGAYNDNNTIPANDSEILDKQYDDTLEEYSKYKEEDYPISMEGDSSTLAPCYAYKPNLVTTGNDIFGPSATSYAAPQVTGVIAQLCGYDPSLKTKQTSMGAILMASCGRKLMSEVQENTAIISSSSFKGGEFISSVSMIGSGNQISNKQGAGKLDAYWAYTIVRDDLYWSLTLGSSVTTYTKNVYITKDSNTLTRIAIFWLMKKNKVLSGAYEQYEEPTGLNWNLTVKDPNGNVVSSSNTAHNNYEIVQFVPPVSGAYTITIERTSASSYPTSYVGLAVW